VVQVIRYPEVRAELNLHDAQMSQVSNILSQVKAKEVELDEEFHRSMVATREANVTERDAMFSRREEPAKRIAEANQELARATEQIIAELTPAQRTELQELCRQALADEKGFQERMTSSQGLGGVSGQSGGSGGGAISISGSGRHEYADGGGPGGVIRVISHPGVQEQLKLSDGQRTKIAEITGQVREFESSFHAGLESSRKSSVAERKAQWQQQLAQRRQRFEQLQQKVNSTRQAVERAGEEMTKLLTPAQQKRLNEIRLQVQGADALFKPYIIRALGLTTTQQIRLGKLKEETNRQVFLAGNEQRRAVQREGERHMISSVLTPEQQRKLQEMKGKEFAGNFGFPAASGGGGGSADASSSSGAQPRGR
jgi:Spy/CpxP family protein refolding chaperone